MVRALTMVLFLSAATTSAVTADTQSMSKDDLKKLFGQAQLKVHDPADAEASISGLFRDIDLDGDGITIAEFGLFETMKRTRERALTAGNRLVHDLNGDLAITRDEVETIAAYKIRRNVRPAAEAAKVIEQNLDSKVDFFMNADTDKNGKIEGNEIVAPELMGFGESRTDRRIDLIRELLKVDPNKDKKLQKSEVMELLQQAL